jgi:hypothetical protein
MFSKFEYDGKLNPTFTEGPFELPFSSIRAYINEPITPRSVFLYFYLMTSIQQIKYSYFDFEFLFSGLADSFVFYAQVRSCEFCWSYKT